MKIRLSLLCIALAIVALSVADAQVVSSLNDGAFARSGFQQFSGDLLNQRGGGTPGRLWFEANVADKNLGFEGSYLTIGGKSRLFEDRLDGRWLVEAQVHHSIEDEGGLFANVGIERVFSIPAAGADISMGVWYDYNGDRQQNFSHTFHQVGISGAIKTRKWDLLANGYIPTGIQDYSYGDITGANCFVGNQIVLTPGIDSALQGFDVALRFRPKQLAMINGSVDIGGYHYNSDLIDAFAGGRVRVGVQALRGMMVNLEINHDDRFDTTGSLGFGWMTGANASGYGNEYSGLGRDLERTSRADHIAIYNRDVEIAFDPATGAAYNVVHVNNNADPAGQVGTAENPYNTLVAAQNLSAPGDVILVNAGDGTDRNMNTGIILQDDQRLWGSGSSILIPIQDGRFFELCNTGGAPTISNNGGFAVVTLANNNDVAGINIDGTGAMFGIFGNGNTVSIRDNTISNANNEGIYLANTTGDISIARNNIANNGRNGVFLLNALDTTANILFDSNTVTGNLMDGIQVRNYDPASIMFVNNTTNNNLRHGLYLENYANTTGGGVTVLAHTADGNAGSGLAVNGGSGNFDLLNSNITNNSASNSFSGVIFENWATADPERILVSTTTGGTSTISGNGAFANLSFLLDDPGIHTRAYITNQTLSDGVRGLAARVDGVNGGGVRSTLDIDIIDNIEISRNINDGISLLALDSGLIRARINNTGAALQILDNARGGGDGISIIADGINGQPQAEVQAVITNVVINNAVNRIIRPAPLTDIVIATDGIGVDSMNNSLVDIEVTNTTIGAADFGGTLDRDTQTGIRLGFDNNGSELINRVNIDNVTLFSDLGVVLQTGTGTYTDFTLANSTIFPNGAQTVGGRSDDTPFGDGAGSIGVFISAFGNADPTGNFNVQLPQGETGFAELVTDGLNDNLTKVQLVNNTIQDFTFEGVDINTFGDAQMLLSLVGNNINNNGAGLNNDVDNNNVYNDIGGVDPNELFFFDGVDINAFDDSTISARIRGNTFTDNFERGLSLNTFNTATINALVDTNVFFGNDRGTDSDATTPIIAAGQTGGALNTAGEFSFEAINNEEYYFRSYESPILLNGAGVPITTGGVVIAAPGLGVFFPGNTGFDIFGNVVSQGTADLNLAMSNNSLQLPIPDLQDFAVGGGDFTLGLDGLTNGFGGGFPGISDVGFGFAETLINSEESFFGTEGF
ncbi:MAG: hypothetical protein ACI814_000829 [Mariniblastus sp.]|jgi:hypothetical protein